MTGTYRPDRANKAEAQPLAKMPQCPGWLTDDGRRLWRRLAKVLNDAGLLTYVDGPALEMLCQSYGRWVEAEKYLGRLRVDQHVVESEKGGLYINPRLNVARMHRNDFLSACREFGMTPAARTRIRIDQPEKEEGIADLLFAAIQGSG